MWDCPICNGRLSCKRGLWKDGKVLRKRVCSSCGHEVYTTEAVTDNKYEYSVAYAEYKKHQNKNK
jgi:DNA-directed RNA polymerase subunit M/transcription elongation factor TFIIS